MVGWFYSGCIGGADGWYPPMLATLQTPPDLFAPNAALFRRWTAAPLLKRHRHEHHDEGTQECNDRGNHGTDILSFAVLLDPMPMVFLERIRRKRPPPLLSDRIVVSVTRRIHSSITGRWRVTVGVVVKAVACRHVITVEVPRVFPRG